jgi:hypothetical protein
MISSTLPVFGAIATWLTPFWLLTAGVLVAMVILALAYGVIRLISRPKALSIQSSLREGFLLPVLILGAVLSAFAIAVAFVVPFEPFVRSLTRLASARSIDNVVEVPADAKSLAVNLGVAPAEVSRLQVTADQSMFFTVELPGATRNFGDTRIDLLPNEEFEWDRKTHQKYLFYGDTTQIFRLRPSISKRSPSIPKPKPSSGRRSGSSAWSWVF